MAKKQAKQTWSRILEQNLRSLKMIWSYQPKLFLSTGLSSFLEAAGPYVTIFLSARIIGELAGNRDQQLLTQLILLQLVSSALISLGGGLLKRWENAEQSCFWHIEDKIYRDKSVSMEFAVIDRQSTHDLYSQISQNRNYSALGLRTSFQSFQVFLPAVFRILGGVALSVTLFSAQIPAGSKLAFLNNPLTILVCILLLISAAALSPHLNNRAMQYWARYAVQAKLGNRISSYFIETACERKRAADIRTYRQYENLLEPVSKKEDLFSPESQIAKWARGPMGLDAACSQALSAILTGMIYLFVCLKAWAGAFGAGAVTQYIGAITNLFQGISGVLDAIGKMRSNAPFLETVFEYLDLPNEMYQGSLTTEKRSDRKYEVEFRDVSFRYPGSETWALRHVSMKFHIGSRLAIVGRNGSGKTTFIKLLCRLYDPTEGEILLNGIDVRKYRYDDYIAVFSVVFQDFRLFALPLGQNVACTGAYDRSRVTDCLQKAGFGERLFSLEKGLDTFLYKDLNKDGVEISGGEAQKIAIARALCKDSPFLILDEPTAALDPIAEAEIYGKFNEIAADKTAVYISHRLSSCKFCDEIAVFDNGQIIQKGSHAELLADTKGKYYELWHAQAQYYTEEAAEALLG